jgi:hypothetical protein
MRKSLIGIATLAAGVLALGTAAVASSAIAPLPGITPSSSITPSSGVKTIVQKGQCSGTSKSSLTVSTDGKSVQVAFRVVEDQLTLNPTPVNRSWSTSLLRNGALVFSGVLSTQPSGSFTVARTFAASPSTTPTTFLGAAKTLDGRESCFAKITL